MIRCSLVLVSICFLAVQAAPELTEAVFDRNIRPFFATYCTSCHGEEKQKAKRRFDQLAFPIPDDDALIDFQDALDAMNLGEMPPEDEVQPSVSRQREVIDWLTAAIAEAQATRTSTGGETVLRRLNRREYKHTVADLLGLDMRGFDPTSGFPADTRIHHLDNQGHALVTSGFLLDRYLDAAVAIVSKALPPLEKPSEQTWEFSGAFTAQPELRSRLNAIELDDFLATQPEGDRQAIRKGHAQLKWNADATTKLSAKTNAALKSLPKTIRLYEHPRSQRHMGSYGYVSEFAAGVPADGFYEITLDVEARHVLDEQARLAAKIHRSDPLLLGIVPGNVELSDLHLPQKLETELAQFSFADEGRKLCTTQIWLHAGTTPRFTFPNGSSVMRPSLIKLGKDLLEAKGVSQPKTETAFVHGIAHAAFPQIWIHSVTIQGPLYPQWPTKTQVDILGGPLFNPAKNASNIRRFLVRAYRRPPLDQEVDNILSVIQNQERAGRSPYQAFQDGLAAVLCSPGFLYLEEAQGEGSDALRPHAIASRLSYFLWASMPDQRLFDLAETPDLLDPDIRQQEVSRMLADPRSDRFVNGFLDSWLTLSSLGETPPDRGLYRAYYDDDLEAASRRETFLFTRHILDEGLSVRTFMDSDFSFLNPALARLYEVDVDFLDASFRKVEFPKRNRGGLLGQASILTVTANGVDTSPIIRGVWLLENFLGTPPSPPPPDVEPLDPDIRGATSIREQLELHREDPNCAECHRRIDPLGFALETYDAIGKFRSDYPKRGGRIDASGVLPSGIEFSSAGTFKSGLLQQEPIFRRALTEKLLSYALGRPMDISDRPEIDAILLDLDQADGSFRFLVERVVRSHLFIQP